MVIWKCTDVFRGIILVLGVEGNWLRGRIFIGEEKSMKGAQGFLALFKKNKS